jgi:hypothetical protein
MAWQACPREDFDVRSNRKGVSIFRMLFNGTDSAIVIGRNKILPLEKVFKRQTEKK